MAKSAAKRTKELRRNPNKNGGPQDNRNNQSSDDSTGSGVSLKYVILIGLFCAVAGAILFPYVGNLMNSNEVKTEERNIPSDSGPTKHSNQNQEKSTDPIDQKKDLRDISDDEDDIIVDASNHGDTVDVPVKPLTFSSDDKTLKIKQDTSKDGDDTVDEIEQKELDKKNKEKSIKKKTNGKNKNDKLPKEIRDFKPTYLKELKPKKIFADGRRIPPIELLPQKPNNSSVKVYMFEEFLSDAECDGLRKAHDGHVTQFSKHDPIVCFDSISTLRKHLKAAKKIKVKVSVNDFTEGTTCLNASFSSQFKLWIKSNWSLSTAFYPGESKFSTIFEKRAKEATGLLPENGGKFQITSYPLGIGYNTHTDCIVGNEDKRDRYATMLIYLDTVEKGGETAFPELGIWVRPKKGRALVWNNMNGEGDCEPMSIHTAAKVEIGNKYILQRWFYYKSFYSLGKRPDEPHLPPREQLQPKVNCDEYEHGSCRWYDEWGYNHLLDYVRQQMTLI